VAQGRPHLKDLCNTVVPKYAAKWELLGTLLGLPKPKLETIQYDCHHKAEECCLAVLAEWLNCDLNASWETIENATKSISEIEKSKKILQWRYEKLFIEPPKVSSKPALPGKRQSQNQLEFINTVCMVHHESNEFTKEDVSYIADLSYYGKITTGDSTHLSSPPIKQPNNYYQKCRKYTNIIGLLKQLPGFLSGF